MWVPGRGTFREVLVLSWVNTKRPPLKSEMMCRMTTSSHALAGPPPPLCGVGCVGPVTARGSIYLECFAGCVVKLHGEILAELKSSWSEATKSRLKNKHLQLCQAPQAGSCSVLIWLFQTVPSGMICSVLTAFLPILGSLETAKDIVATSDVSTREDKPSRFAPFRRVKCCLHRLFCGSSEVFSDSRLVPVRHHRWIPDWWRD